MKITKESLLALWFKEENWNKIFPKGSFLRDFNAYIPTLTIGEITLETAPCRTMTRNGYGPWQEVDGIKYRFVDKDGENYYDFNGRETEQFGFQSTFEYFLEHLQEQMPKPQTRIHLKKGNKFVEYPTGDYAGCKSKAHWKRRYSPEFKGGRIKEVLQMNPEKVPCGKTMEYA